MAKKSGNQPAGVQTKPFTINFIALAHTVGPVSLIIYSFTTNDYRYLSPTHWSWLLNAENVIFILVSPVIAYGIFVSHLFGWILSLAFLIYCILSVSYSFFFSPFETFTLWQYGVFLLSNVFIIGALVSKETREPFFHPKMQWWKHDPRVKVSLPVRLENSRQTLNGYTHDLSKSGLYFVSDAGVHKEDPFQLFLTISDTETVAMEAKVIWVNNGRKKDIPPGFGMRFVQMDRSVKNQVKELVRSKQKEKLT